MSIKHLVNNGIRDFYIYDHGSDPSISSFLPEQFPSDSIRLSVIYKESPYFYQREMVSVLTCLAILDGFDVSVGFDADEFWCSTVKGNSLAQQIDLELSSGIDALRVPVLNYAQNNDVQDFNQDGLLGCQYSVVPHVDTLRPTWEQVADGLPFIAIPFPSKVIARLLPNIQYTDGQHDIIKDEGPGHIVDAIGILVRHLPQPAKNHVKIKREQGRRIISAGFGSLIGWQSQSLAYKTDEELNTYWNNNSWRLAEGQGPMVGSYSKIIKDDGLVEIGQQLMKLGNDWKMDLKLKDETPILSNKISSDKLEHVIEQLVDNLGKTERKVEKLVIARDQANAMGNTFKSCLVNFIHLLRPIEKKLRAFRRAYFGNS